MDDRKFDRIFSPMARENSTRHWTPLAVARRAASLLSQGEACRILDVGSGAGKFCLVGALTTPAHFHGVEQRSWLVEEANQIAATLDVPRVQFRRGNALDLDWSSFDGFYFYNPFHEHLGDEFRLDDRIAVGADLFATLVATTRRRLHDARTGTRVASFHGFGDEMPESYDLVVRESHGNDFLHFWVKRR